MPLDPMTRFFVADWKVIAIGFIAFFAAIRRFVGKLFGGGKELGPPPGE